ncbi:hypothetical protein NST17_19590 [Caldifermentibacillus hisashii]|uniref:Gamma-glutamylcyclotransferase AIG2-like domain-containing protein n=1 Tax=Caldifermentibacillus hisashii TaxID=996558 RepID=A0ABU9K480_9BACI
MNFGTVEFEGKVFNLLEEADLTNRVLGGVYTDYNDASDEEVYHFEMKAKAIDQDGKECVIYWIFQDAKGHAKELDEFDYTLVNRIEYDFI